MHSHPKRLLMRYFWGHQHLVFVNYQLCGGEILYQQIALQKRKICLGGRYVENKGLKNYQHK